MQEIIISKNEAGQRFDKFLVKYFKEAGSGFIYKMLRKKNIELNGKKATGNEKLSQGDSVKFFMADETIAKFRGHILAANSNTPEQKQSKKSGFARENMNILKLVADNIVYEDENVLFLNKPSGILSQKAAPSDISINEMIIDYLLEKGELTEDVLMTFKPSVCNRLDRNTTGLISFGKSLAGLQELSKGFKDRSFDKYYLSVVWGNVIENKTIEGYLSKNISKNKVSISTKLSDNSSYIRTYYEPLKHGYIEVNGKEKSITLLKIKLITGKTHQIRAHLSSIGHGILGDDKYGNKNDNTYLKSKLGIKYQMLHSWQLCFGHLTEYEVLKVLENKSLVAKPDIMYKRLFNIDIDESM